MSIDIDAIERLAALPVGKIEELISQFNAAELDAHKETTNALIRLQDKTADFYGAELLAMCAEVRELRGAMAAQDKRIETAGLRVGLFYGTDTPEYMADSIEELRAALERERMELVSASVSVSRARELTLAQEIRANNLSAALNRARALLAELEWCGVDNWLECPWCLGTKAEHYGEPAGHKPDCKLAAFLAAGGEARP